MCPTQVAQLYSVAEASKNETGGGEGVEVQKVNYNAEASYRVQVINMRGHQAEKPESVESETVLERDPNFKVKIL